MFEHVALRLSIAVFPSHYVSLHNVSGHRMRAHGLICYGHYGISLCRYPSWLESRHILLPCVPRDLRPWHGYCNICNGGMMSVYIALIVILIGFEVFDYIIK